MRKNHDEQHFYGLYSQVFDRTMLGTDRLRGLYDAVMTAVEIDIPGDIVECGTAFGGSAALMGLTLQEARVDRRLWVCDTFEGLPAPTEEDPSEAQQYTGQFKGELAEVKQMFKQLGIKHCQFVKGLFQDTLPCLQVKKIAVLHLDGDWYASTKCGLENLYDKVSPGGIIQIDDYGHWAGCRKAVDEFFDNRNIHPTLLSLDYTGVQFIKERIV